LAVAFEAGGFASVLYVIGLVTALLTAFYMTRQWVMVFLGEPRWDEGLHPHESPRVMTAPLVVLAVLSVVAGFVNTPFRLGLEHFLEPAFEGISLAHPPEGIAMFLLLAAVSVGAGLVGIAMGGFVYTRPRELWDKFQTGFGKLWDAWETAYRVDDIYGAAVVTPGKKLSEAAAFKVDLPVIDGAVNGVARFFMGTGNRVRVVQSGFVRSYGVAFVGGLVLAVVWLLWAGGA
ncbi:MAG: NADH-quinone oxidoreductase subunit L, partial [Acidimicrobiia bacterium]|nr:NADH-quinone oxidoreductase subunit L [Acidimicrobiia bacterium]